MIWDTDTHNMYKAEKRREITVDTFPRFGFETEKPRTKPVFLGDDCWLGKDVSILKGSTINNKCIVGMGAKVVNINIPENKTVISKDNFLIKENNL